MRLLPALCLTLAFTCIASQATSSDEETSEEKTTNKKPVAKAKPGQPPVWRANNFWQSPGWRYNIRRSMARLPFQTKEHAFRMGVEDPKSIVSRYIWKSLATDSWVALDTNYQNRRSYGGSAAGHFNIANRHQVLFNLNRMYGGPMQRRLQVNLKFGHS